MRFDQPIVSAATRVNSSLEARDERLAVAESCTGGLVAAAITAPPGASAVFDLGVVAYANAAKVAALDVPTATIEQTGAVSGPTARAMAAGVRDRANADWGLSITGIAGPTGGSPGKPVGTVFIGIAWREETRGRSAARRFRFDGDRDAIRHQTTRTALERLAWTIDTTADYSR